MERRLLREEMRLRVLELRIARERDAAQRGRLRTETLLRKLDALSGRLALEDQRLRVLNRKMRVSEERLGRIRAEFGRLQSEQGERRSRILLRLRALYMEGPIGPVRLLINSRSVWDILDRWSLLTQLSRHDLALIKRFRSQEKRLGELEAASEEEVARRAALRERQARVKRRIGRYYGLRARELSRLERSKGRRRRLLDELSGARNALRDMVASLMRARDAEEAGSASPLDAKMGLLPWPVKGEPLPAEGRGGGREGGAAGERNPGRGIRIRAAEGAPIRPVAAGEIVFEDWVRGYGRLLVLRHGGGFYTVYGGAGEVFVDKGERVGPRKIIARVGTTDVLGEPSLYFEIRRGPIPLNPLHWLSPRR
ncbi:MAG: peptidoglycan DD-metalloendopeptidase family protein [bacterium]